MKPNELAAAVERLRLAETDFAATYRSYPEPHAQLLRDRETLAAAYIAREADDAKPVTREWLVSVLGEPDDNATSYWAEWWRSTWRMTCDGADSFAVSAWCGPSYLHAMENRGDVRAFLRLARWPIHETNGGE